MTLPEIEFCDDPVVCSISGKVVTKSLYIRYGDRKADRIFFIGLETMASINQFLRSQSQDDRKNKV
jgi:hypothetical protein